jgi:hypothetical protein
MYGKHYESMYDGSLVGSGSHVFAVMGYVIAKQKPNREFGSVVRLNPLILAPIIGETKERIVAAIELLCAPDAKTTTPDEEGRRLVQIGPFDYRVVNGEKYRNMQNEKDRQEQFRQAKIRSRETERQSPVSKPEKLSWIDELLKEIGEIFRRGNRRPTEPELRLALEIVNRPEWRDELKRILEFNRKIKPSDRRFQFPMSLYKILEDWNGVLDRAALYNPNCDQPMENQI